MGRGGPIPPIQAPLTTHSTGITSGLFQGLAKLGVGYKFPRSLRTGPGAPLNLETGKASGASWCHLGRSHKVAAEDQWRPWTEPAGAPRAWSAGHSWSQG